MTCAIMQPTYYPWLGYFDMIDQCEKFVLYDDVQLTRRSWQVRNRIKSATGELFLTIPIKKTLSRDELTINRAEINYDENWQRKHLRSIENAYKKSACFHEIFPFIENFYKNQTRYLNQFNNRIIITIAKKMGILAEFIESSSLPEIKGTKDARLAAICKRIGAENYLSSQGSAEYIESRSPGGQLSENGINVYYHNYNHPVYNQLYGDFIPYMGIIDLLFNVGFENALSVIKSGRLNKYSVWEYREKILGIT